MAQSKSKRKKVAKPPYELPPPELVVMVHPEAGLRAGAEELVAAAADPKPLAETIGAAGAELTPLFGASEQRLRVEAATAAAQTGAAPPDLSVYYQAEGAKDPAALAEELAALDIVEAAYVKPPTEPPAFLTDLAPQAAEPPTTTPDFSSHQGYLDAAPGGVDARYAWGRPGGDGAGVRIVDVEGAWRFTHEDLGGNQGGVIGGSMSPELGWRNHGTAVAGEFSGDTNAFGVTGISPAANLRTVSIFGPGMGSAQAIRQAANALSAGDILLIELHRPGPRHNFQERGDQLGYIAVEWDPVDFDAILYATSRGVIVVEAGGNGAENLDDAIYNQPAPGFPAGWTNPFNRANRDSGAIVVGAGAPPPGTHGREHGPDRSRLDFSNYGALIDAQGWGREVTTCGYGDLQGGAGEDVWYTDQFSGTSSASPIVVGTLASLQGVARNHGRTLTPAQCRAYLRETGSPQQASPAAPVSQRIGNRPDLRALIASVEGILKHKPEVREKLKVELKEKREKNEKLEHEIEPKHVQEEKLKVEKLEKPEKREKNEKREFEVERKPIKEKDGKEAEIERGGNIFERQRLRAPGINDLVFKGIEKDKPEKDEKENKKEKFEKEEKEEKDHKDNKDESGEKNAKDKEFKDEKGEQDGRGKDEQADAAQKYETDSKYEADKGFKDEKSEKDGKETKDSKDDKDGIKDKDEKFEIKDKELRIENKFEPEFLPQRRQISHFIDRRFRPDLSEGALAHESDVAKLDKEAAEAKRSKDAKDIEKLTEA